MKAASQFVVAVFLSWLGSATQAAESSALANRPGIVSWPAPAGEALSEDYQLKVNGQPVSVYACRVSAVPFSPYTRDIMSS